MGSCTQLPAIPRLYLPQLYLAGLLINFSRKEKAGFRHPLKKSEYQMWSRKDVASRNTTKKYKEV